MNRAGILTLTTARACTFIDVAWFFKDLYRVGTSILLNGLHFAVCEELNVVVVWGLVLYQLYFHS